jgi:hypothetical protein
MAAFEIVVYPSDINSAELALSRLGWQVVERHGDPADDGGVIFRIPADEVLLELVTHDTARALVAGSGGSDVIAGLRLYVEDADAAWKAAKAAGLRLDAVCADAPSLETWGRLVRTYAAGGLRIDFVQRPDA